MKNIFLILIITLTACSTQKQPHPEHLKMPTQEEIQARMEQSAAVTVNHEVLKRLVGNWKTESKFWMDPTKEPVSENGSVKVSSVLGGRYIRQEYKGISMGKNFEGLGYIGYDNEQKSYISTWADNFSSATTTSKGSFDPATDTFTFTGKMSCPVAKQEMAFRETLQFKDKKTFIFTMYNTFPGQTEQKGFEITHTRK